MGRDLGVGGHIPQRHQHQAGDAHKTKQQKELEATTDLLSVTVCNLAKSFGLPAVA